MGTGSERSEVPVPLFDARRGAPPRKGDRHRRGNASSAEEHARSRRSQSPFPGSALSLEE